MIALLIAAAVSMGVSLIGTQVLVPWLTARGVGQPIRLDGPQGHLTKAVGGPCTSLSMGIPDL